MSIRMFQNHLSSIKSWSLFHHDLSEKTGFPISDVERALEDDSFESAWAAIDRLERWIEGVNASSEADRISEVSGHIHEARIQIRICLVSYEDQGDGTVRAVPDGSFNLSNRDRYHTLANAALYHGVQVSCFDREIKAEPVYDGREALDAGYAGLKDLKPVGTRASYRITVLDGKLHTPPLWPSEAIAMMPSGPREDDIEPGI